MNAPGYYKKYLLIAVYALVTAAIFLSTGKSFAVPGFARQTGLDCYNCHTVWPELTPMGRSFKLGGFVQSTADLPYEPVPPLSVAAVFSYTKAPGLNNGVSPFDANHRDTDKTGLPSELSLFYAGRIYDKFGALLQGNYDGNSNKVFLELADVRYADDTATLAAKPLTYGFTINNSPSSEDIWNTTPHWGFPYQESSVAIEPFAGTKIDGALENRVGGIGAYAFWNNLIYLESAVYRTTRTGITRPLGAGTYTDSVVKDAVFYWRAAIEKQCGQEHSLMAGTYGMTANIYPTGYNFGPSDRFTDLALDAQYQYISPWHTVSVATTWIAERQNNVAGFALGKAANPTDTLKTFRANLNYSYRSQSGTIGATAGYFSTTGSRDTGLYPVDTRFTKSAPGASGTPGTSGSPNGNGFIIEADYLPVKYVKLAAQYTAYAMFDGSRSNYDGFGTSASHNNTLFLYLKIMY
ncbi:MAG: hypothetical protein HQK89_12170 [Nitrospirae bacterium]|nr:hypothetical protein [Nitrospirota bacterium]